ncbi:alpha-ketoglutarate-dependent dioxygenase AlkB family protein [Luteococcus sp. Sow4_B9]|uniref:alpha-ketoglutarate-dependent dioxygenase AlkB family protein n=1 Tax=Luteococcus sp. Sow4_B9 TaxID=3438792 RepID=UPI003F995E13
MESLFGDEPCRPTVALPPGAHHVPGFLTLEQQRWLVDRFHAWGRGPVPPRYPRVGGHPMSVQSVCLGWHWTPGRLTREAIDQNGERVPPVPDWMVRLGQRALLAADGYEELASAYQPDCALVNYYDDDARMGMHQDKDERSPAPVVSISIGNSCRFRFGNTETRNKPWVDLELRSGDLFVFGGPSRMAFHGVTKVIPGTAPAGCGLTTGRVNITLRVTGLA